MADESLLADADASTPSDEVNETTTETEAAPWYMAENVPGEGDKPEWLKDSKYKSVADQAKAYTELEKKLGGFTGAPEEYELSMPDGIEGEFIEDDPLMDGFKTWARENNLSQEKFTDLLHLYVNNEASIMGTDRETELRAIGENAEGRLKSIDQFAKANLSEEDYIGLKSVATTAAGVKAIEALIAKTKTPKIPTDMSESSTGVTKEEIQARVADPQYQTSAAFRAETDKMRKALYGDGPMKRVVG